jgi:hypothetical protein
MKHLGLLLLLLPALASSKPAESLCYLATDPKLSRGDSPVERGIDVEVVCAHASRVVLSADVAKLDILDGRTSLLAQGRAYVESYQKKHPKGGFFSSRPLNAIRVEQLRERVARLRLVATELPKGNKVVIKGQVRLGVAGTKTKTLETSAAAVRARKLGEGIEVKEGGFIGADKALMLGGSAVYAGFKSAPAGVEDKEIFGTRCFVLPDSVPDSAKIVFLIRGAEPVTVPVHIEVPVD